MTQLESLEIGHCVSWSSAADYEMLSKLQHLRHLRIEQGPSVGILQYLEASLSGLCHLQHLEIVNFTVDTQIQEFKLTNLKRLLMIPKYSNEVTTTFSVTIFKLRNSGKMIIFSFFLDFGHHDPKCVWLCLINDSFAAIELDSYRWNYAILREWEVTFESQWWEPNCRGREYWRFYLGRTSRIIKPTSATNKLHIDAFARVSRSLGILTFHTNIWHFSKIYFLFLILRFATYRYSLSVDQED